MSPRADNVATGTESEWETVVEPFGESWDFTKNPVLIGTYNSNKEIELDDTQNPGKKRMSKVYEVETVDTGEKVSVWGTFAIDQAFEQIEPGTIVRIEHKGKIPIHNGAQTVNQFVVQTQAKK